MSLRPPSPQAPTVWLYSFVVLQFVCQAALVAPLGSARIGFRILVFLSSIVLLIFLPFSTSVYPLRRLGMCVLIIIALGMLHPQLHNPVAGLAAFALNLAIFAPIFWVDRIKITPEAFSRILLFMWAFHLTSAFVGVLQVYDPDRFAPEAEFVEKNSDKSAAEGLKFKLDDGRVIYRPFGLTDTPGGASVSGGFAATVGISLFASHRSFGLRAAGAVAGIIGMFCLYLCQVRSVLIVTCLGFVFMATVNLARGHVIKSGMLIGAIAVAVLAGFVWATQISGDAVTKRLDTLIEDNPGTVFYSNRGMFLETTLNEDIPNYPLGAGLGRWGMINTYFGDTSSINSAPLWAEIQPTAWVFDGGIPLLLIGYVAIISACIITVKIAIAARSESVTESACVVAVTNVSTLVVTLNYPIFISQGGMMFWVLNAALFASSVTNLAPVSLCPSGNSK